MSLFVLFAVPAKAQWIEQPQFHTSNDLHDLRMSADGRGIAVGEGNVLLCTIDGGSDWDGTGSAAADLIAADLADGIYYFCNVLGAQYRETNPATCDNELVAASVAPLNGTTDLVQLDANRGWLAAAGRIWYSDNGWSSSTAVSNIGCPIQATALYSVSDTLAFSVGSNGNIHRIQRLGSTFICSQRYDSGLALEDVDGDGLGLFAVGENGTVVESGDGGLTWAPQAALSSGSLGAVDLRSVQVRSEAAYLAGGKRIYRLDRTFGTWTEHPLPGLIGSIRAVHMASVDLGWAVGDNGYIAFTGNAGGPGDPVLGGLAPSASHAVPSWTVQPNPSRESLHIRGAAAGSPWRLLGLDARHLAHGVVPGDGIVRWSTAQDWHGLAILQLEGQGQRLVQRMP